MRLISLSLLLFLLVAAPASAQVSDVAVDNTAPSAAAGALTVYRVTFTVNAPLQGATSGGVRVQFPAGTGFEAFRGGTIVSGGTGLGGCSAPVGLTVECDLNTSASVAAGSVITVSLRGVSNPSTPGPIAVQASTTAEPTPVAAPATVVAGQALTSATLVSTAPSAAEGARTRYVVDVGLSSTGGLSGEAGSAITLTLPTNTFHTFSGTIVHDGQGLGGCSAPVGATVRCALNTSASVPAGATVRVTLRGVVNPAQGTGHVITARTSTDLPNVSTAPFAVVDGGAVTNVVADHATPSGAAGARTRYAVDFTLSGTGGLSGEANSQIALTMPTGTSYRLFSGTITADGETLGGCSSPSGSTIVCSLNSSAAAAPGTPVRVTLRGVVNPAAGARTVQVATSSDLPAVASAPFTVTDGGAVTDVVVAHDTPSPAAGARTRYVVDFTTSATGGLAGQGNSEIELTLPPGTTFTAFSGTVSTGDTTLGGCSSPTATVVTCSLNFSAAVPGGARVRVALRGVVNSAAAPDKRVRVRTTSDLPDVDSAAFAIVPGATVGPVSVTAPAGPSEAGAYVVRFRTSATGGLTGAAGSAIELTLPAGTGFGGFTGGTIGASIGGCSSPVGLTVTCWLNGSAAVLPGEEVQVTLRGVTNPASAPPYRLAVATSSDLPPVTSAPYNGVDGPAEPTPAAPPPPRATPTATVTPTPTVVVAQTPTPTPAAEPVRGTVKVKRPGSNRYVELAAGQDLPLGSTVDTKKGAVRVGDAEFSAGIFKLSRSRGVTVLTLTEPLACSKKQGRASAAKKKKKAKTRKLWGKGKGAFRTSGRYSAATVRGTTWLVKDTCTSTLTRVTQGSVTVRDFARKKNVVVRAGKRYTAKKKR